MKIRGNTVGTPVPRSDLRQTDPKKADYIKGRELLMEHIAAKGNVHGLTAGDIGLGNADNTSDMDKPVSTAQENAIAEARTEAQNNLNAHAANKQNPHETTAQQIGAEPAGTAESKVGTHNVDAAAHADLRLRVSDLTSRLNTLANSKVSVADIIDNLVTNVSGKPLSAAQGVVLKGLIDALSSEKLSLSGGTMTGNINMGGNQIKGLGTPTENGDAVPKSYVDDGFAPAGYGLGGNAATIADLNTLVSGFYKWDASAKNRPFDYGTAIVLSRDGSSGAEICIGITGTYKGVIVVRTKNSEGWIEEYVNPPMVPGVEYRTTERWAGAPVYTMLIEAGAIPNASRSAISYPNSIVPSRVLRVCGQISSGETIPSKWGDSEILVYASRSYIYIETNDGGWSMYAAQVQVWYTK